MNTKEILQRFEESTNLYLRELNNFSMEQLNRQPSESEWSLGQVYLHLINSALYMQLRNVEICRDQDPQTAGMGGEKTEAGEAVLSQGSFPAMRIQVPPSPQYTPQQPESKEQIINGLNDVLRRMKEIEPTLDDIPPLCTALHPRLGALNAKEWFALIEMHYRHHFLQKERLERFIHSEIKS
jgi:hypothetical protein